MTVAIASSNCAALITDTRMSISDVDGTLVRTEDGVEKLHPVPGGWMTGTGDLTAIQAVVEEIADMGQTWDSEAVQRAVDLVAELADGRRTGYAVVRRCPTVDGFARHYFEPGKPPVARGVNDPRELVMGWTFPPDELPEGEFEESFIKPLMLGMHPIVDMQRRTRAGIGTEHLQHIVNVFAQVHASGVSRHVGPEVAMGFVLPTDVPGGYENHRVVMEAKDLAEALQEGQLVDFLERSPGAGARLG